jgi:L-ascorbate metabolism protein UlaG (beta-lactamase superfamily)
MLFLFTTFGSMAPIVINSIPIMSRLGETLVPLAIAISLVFPRQFSHAETIDIESLARAKAHHKNPGFTNPWLADDNPGELVRFLKWRFSANPFREEKKTRPVFQMVNPDVKKIQEGGDSITYLGHGTLWLRLLGKNILTDPIFGDVSFFFDRFVPFPLAPPDLPPIQVVLISHSHFDHLDSDSIRKLGPAPLYLVPLGYRDWFEHVVPGAKVVELDWFQSHTYEDITYRFLPTQHWTQRTPFDTNRRLWGSWLIEAGTRKVYYAGDSSYFHGFAEYGEKFGPIDAALLPIAAYEPRWFMSRYHMSPDEAVKSFLELRAEYFIPQQWGVFDLTDEPMDAPPKDYREAANKARLPEERTPLILHGETWNFPGNR